MLTQSFKFFIALSVMLAFVAQSVAVVAGPCLAMGSEPGSVMMDDMAGMDHSGHDMPAMVDEADCCSEDGCVAMSCLSSLAFFVVIEPLLHIEFSGILHTDYTLLYLSRQFTSLYRPPISR